jgi:hypothetical protein
MLCGKGKQLEEYMERLNPWDFLPWTHRGYFDGDKLQDLQLN